MTRVHSLHSFFFIGFMREREDMAIFMLQTPDVMKKSAYYQPQKTSAEHLWQYL